MSAQKRRNNSRGIAVREWQVNIAFSLASTAYE